MMRLVAPGLRPSGRATALANASRSQSIHQRLKKDGESGTPLRPRHVGQVDAVLWILHAGDLGDNHRMVMVPTRVQVAPFPAAAVVARALQPRTRLCLDGDRHAARRLAERKLDPAD